MIELIDQYSVYIKVILPVSMLVILWSWETIAPFFDFRTGRWWHASQNLLLTMMNGVLMSVIMVPVVLNVLEQTRIQHYGLLNYFQLAGMTKMCCAIILLDSWLYLWHRLNHSIPFLWRFHRVHHADTAMDVTTATRFHLGELFFSKILMLGLIPLLGLELVNLIVYEALIVLNTQIHHANISLGKWDRWLRMFIVSPYMHKVHHSIETQETNSNYGTVFSVWDRIWGSYAMRHNPAEIVLGLLEMRDNRWKNVWGMLMIPFVRNSTAKPDLEK